MPMVRFRVLAALLGVAAVAVGSVVAVDAWRGGVVHPEPCGSLLAQPRGELLDDSDVLTRAWAALTDPEADTLGDLDGSRFVRTRSCVLFAGRLGGTGDPHVVVAETTVTGLRSLFRVAELQVPERGPTHRATSAHTVLLGAELKRGVVLPLPGYYLAGDADVTGVRVRTGRDGFTTTDPAGDLGGGVFNIRAVADYTLAPAVQGEHVAAALVLDRAGGDRGPLAALVPVVPAPGRSRPHRPVIALDAENVGGMQAIAPVLPLLVTDPRFLRELDRSALATAVEAGAAPIPGGLRVEMALRYPFALHTEPFVYAVRNGVAQKEERG